MRDKRFVIAIVIIVILAFALLYITLIGPKIQGYLIKGKVEAQQSAVNSIIDIVNQNGYVVLSNDQESVVLMKYQNPEQQSQTKSATTLS